MSEEEQEESSGKQTKTDIIELNERIAKEETDINKELFKKIFNF